MNEETTIHTAPASDKGASTAILTGAALLGGAALLSSARPAKAVTPALTFADIPGATGDIKTLNYALSLEALEADLYRQAQARLAALGKTSSLSYEYIVEFGKIEIEHRNFLQGALQSAAITAPGQPLANATFDFGINSLDERGVVDLVLNAEALGVRAYLGAIPFFSTATYLQTAAAIQGTEARHTAAIAVIRNRLFGNGSEIVGTTVGTNDPVSQQVAPKDGQGLGNSGIDVPLEPNAVLKMVSPFIVLN